MKASVHLYSSALLGGSIYKISQSAEIAIVAFLSGFLIDLDHVVDFLFLSGEKFNLKDMLSWCHNGRWEKIVLILHSYELYLLLGFLTYFFPHNIFIGLLLGTGLHLILDQIWNCHLRSDFRISPWFYFLAYRVHAGFHRDKLLIMAS